MLEDVGVQVTSRQAAAFVDALTEVYPRLTDSPRAQWTRWSEAEVADALEMRARGIGVPAIAKVLGKTDRQVRSMLDRAREA